MAAALYLGQGVLAVLALVAGWFTGVFGESLRARALAVAGIVGAGLGLTLLFFARSDETWRTAAFSGAVAVAGAGAICAWLLTAATPTDRSPWPRGVLVGVAGAALALAAGNQWVVPALLFWVCSSLAIATLAGLRREGVGRREGKWLSFPFRSGDEGGRVAVWVAIFASDAAFAAGLIGHALESDSWRIPTALDGWPLAAVLGAAVVRSGVIPKTGIWGAVGSPGSALLPLATAGSFVLVSWSLGDALVWPGVALVLLAIATAVWGLARPRLNAVSVGAVPVALALGAAVTAPSGVVVAGIAAVIAIALVAMWPLLQSSGEGARSLHLAFVPPTVGFVAITIGAVAAFDRAVASEKVAETVVNVLFSALAPVALAVTVALGARVARAGLGGRPEESEVTRDPPAVSAVAWVLLAASIAITVVPPDVLVVGAQPLGALRTRLLFAVAAAIGIAVAWLFRGVEAEHATDEASEISFAALTPRTTKVSGKVLGYVAVLLALGAVAAVGAFTVYGLRLGFL